MDSEFEGESTRIASVDSQGLEGPRESREASLPQQLMLN